MTLIIEKAEANYLEAAIRLATEVFAKEQNIPEEMTPLRAELQPVWWCARYGEEVIGACASWKEADQWHWGRFVVDKSLRGRGIGKELAVYSLKQIFAMGADKIFAEARFATVKLLEKLGGKVSGETIDFYGEPVTPIIVRKQDFALERS